MSIHYSDETKTITLNTKSTTYQLQVDSCGHLLHLYYGKRIPGDCMDYQYIPMDHGFSPNPYGLRWNRRISMDVLPQEYACANTGDFRTPALELSTDAGAYGADLIYQGHRIEPGKLSLETLPAARAEEGECETLLVDLSDEVSGLRVQLRYAVYEARDVIVRSAVLTNGGASGLWLERAASASVDIPFGSWELINFHGRHMMERVEERERLTHGVHTISSRRGASSHQHNPFVVLCERSATEDSGECLGVMLAYSGSFRIDVELDQLNSVRAVAGINDAQFRWRLNPGDSFETPEVFLAFTANGLAELSHIYHNFLRGSVIPARWVNCHRPVLINNWEATYIDFDAEKILAIARKAAAMGVEMFVLDDGWFGHRDDDNSSLGDWFVNERKLPGGLAPLIASINELGLKFGIWIEPEMVSEDSELFRAHPDWALTVPGRAPSMCRNQMVLDMANPAVVEHLYQVLSNLLRTQHIEYIKWDMNRNMTDVYSHALPAERQGETFHRYILGVYELARRLTTEFPDVLFEGCSGGGGRFDAGMLHYFPQIWCSDDSDAIERLEIQRGTSFGYPVSAVGAHLSASPNEQTGRAAPFGTRAIVAMSGTFGYELDPDKLTDEEKDSVREQIARFDRYYDLIQRGDYYRLAGPDDNDRFQAWQFAAPDGSQALVNLVVTHTRANFGGIHFRLKGLDPNAMYKLAEHRFEGCRTEFESLRMDDMAHCAQPISGASLMYAGYTLPRMGGDYPSAQLLFVRQN